MEQIKITKLIHSNNSYESCTINMPVGNNLPILRANKNHVLMHKDYVKWFACLMDKLKLGEYDRIIHSIVNNRVLVMYQISTNYTFVKVRCANPDVGLAYYMGHKKGIRYLSREEAKMRRTPQV